jgi:uncharacterized protein YraI
MNLKLHGPRGLSRRARALAVVFMLAAGAVTASAATAKADPFVYTVAQSTPEAYGPYLASQADALPKGASFNISCYVTGQTVSGPYGSENVWDLVDSNPYEYGVNFVPDADVYTGSNSPVVPRCSNLALGSIIGNNPVSVLNSPGGAITYDTLHVGEQVELRCYTPSSTWVSGPYGSENIWDQLADWAGQSWIPDALVYTGSNQAVVPHC